MTGPSDAALERGTILLVDDDDAIRSSASRTLERAGFHVQAVATGREALEHLVAHDRNVALIITDLAMPGMSGFAVAGRAAQRWPHIAVLFMSGFSADPAAAQLPATTRVQYLAKPFTAVQLLAQVTALLEEDR
jgi:CheY-like chemotaxis protein